MSPQNRKRSSGRPRPQSRPGQRPSGQRRPGSASANRPADADPAGNTEADAPSDTDAVTPVAAVQDAVEAADDGESTDDGVVMASAPAVTEGESAESSGDDEDDAAYLVDLPEPSSAVTDFWESVGIDPVLISLPGVSGLTLRCYLDVDAEDDNADPADDDADDEPDARDDADDDDSDDAETSGDDDEVDAIDGSPTVSDGPAGKPAARRSGKVEGESTSIEPRFLGDNGAILVFSTAESLVAYVRSDATHPLTEAPGWAKVRKAATLDPTPELLNRYELDMVVDIARAGADGWGEQERQTLLLAGEMARDAAAFCGLPEVQAMLGPGSPLDALDDDLRKGGFLAKRRLRKYNADQIALSWRRIIRELRTVVQHH